MKEFDGQVAVVTGGARGIGAEIARRLATGGASVVCADVLDTSEIVAEINDAGGNAPMRLRRRIRSPRFRKRTEVSTFWSTTPASPVTSSWCG
jgi:NAD(P)-dependent dehydrogenase (short-subunit alcohol dehydrogenase family)